MISPSLQSLTELKPRVIWADRVLPGPHIIKVKHVEVIHVGINGEIIMAHQRLIDQASHNPWSKGPVGSAWIGRSVMDRPGGERHRRARPVSQRSRHTHGVGTGWGSTLRRQGLGQTVVKALVDIARGHGGSVCATQWCRRWWELSQHNTIHKAIAWRHAIAGLQRAGPK